MFNSNLISALRGPVVLLTLGILLVLSNQDLGAGRAAFRYTWPSLIIVYGLFKLLEAVAGREQQPPPPIPPSAPFTGGQAQ